MDFLNFFGLNEDPFKLTPDPAYYYPSSSHNEGLLLMDYSIEQKEGFLTVIGDPGTGKTTLLNVFLEKWKTKAEIAIILTPRLLPEEFLTAVAEDLNISLENKNKNDLIKALRDFMTMKSSENRRVIIIVDEAQNLPDETMEELRLLSNLETDKDKLLQIILLGQPELEANLMKDNLRQLNQRITTRVYLKHFNPDETQDYINYRAIKAGKKNLQMDKRASRLAYQRSQGTPRLINMLISRALMAAYVDEDNLIQPKHIEHALKSLNHSDMKVPYLRRLAPVSAAVVSAVLVIAAAFSYVGITEWPGAAFMAGGKTAEALKQVVSAPAPSKVVSVRVHVALVRNNPSINAGKAGWTSKGSQLIVLNESIDNRDITWYQVPYEGGKRWISGEVVDVIELDQKDPA